MTEFKGVQHSDETIYPETHHYTAMSGHFKAPADLHRKKEPLLRTEEKVGGSQRAGPDVLDKKKIFLPRGCDLPFLSRLARYVVTGTTEISGSISLLMQAKPSQHLRGFVHTDMHSVPSAGIATNRNGV